MEILPLKEVIRGLRTELVEAAGEVGNERVKFAVGAIELEFQVVVKREAEGGGKLGFHIFAVTDAEISLGGKGGDERTQRVKLTLTPSVREDDASATSLEISRRTRKRGETQSEEPSNSDP